MKKFLTVVTLAFVTATLLGSQAFAYDNAPQCPKISWKHGHYVCDTGDNS